jgi:hypothetical protein
MTVMGDFSIFPTVVGMLKDDQLFEPLPVKAFCF